MSIFWLDNPKILYENDNYLDFIPQKNMSRTEQLNSITRLSIYVFIILILFGIKSYYVVPLVIIILTIIANHINVDEIQYKQDDMTNNSNEQIEQFHGVSRDRIHDVDSQNYVVQSGYYNSDNHMNLGEYYGPSSNVNYHPSTKTKKCRKPTYDNPFMNPSILDFNVPDDTRTLYDEACYDTINSDCAIKKEMNEQFNRDLFRDVGDLYNARGGERQFYTTPSTSVPNDQDGFGQWLFGDVGTCKSDLSKCYPLENLRASDDFLYSH